MISKEKYESSSMEKKALERENYSTDTEWEPIVGYSRAVKIGNVIHVSGTTATNKEGNLVGVGDPVLQTQQTIENIQSALNYFGVELNAVYRTRIYVVDIEQWELIGKMHGQYFSSIRPASTMVEVSRLISPELLVEIEAEAYIE